MKAISFVICFCIILFTGISIAQSDYEIVQNFKNKSAQIEQRIKDASSMDEINNIASDIELLKSQFADNKELLDKSLYPTDFNTTYTNLKTALDIRVADFTQIEVLQTEVLILKEEVDKLNTRNSELINQIAAIESVRGKDAETIERLNRLVNELQNSLLERDKLVLSIVDSLIPHIDVDVSALTADEKQKIVSSLENNFVLNNVKRSLRDHIRFLDVTTLTPDDINEIKEQQDEFVSTWQKIGVRLVEVYSNTKDKSAELKEIDALFSNWQATIKNEAWNSIREEFAINNIFLQDFNSGQGFQVEITRYIDEQFANYEDQIEEELQQTYTIFVDSVWNKSIEPQWIPYLIDNDMLSPQQKNLLESKISDWKNIAYPTQITPVYYIAGGLLLLILLFFIIKKLRTPSAQEQKPDNTNL